MRFKTIRYACACGATLVVTDLPIRADLVMQGFKGDHRGEGCHEDDYMAARAAQERLALAQDKRGTETRGPQ